MLLEQSLLWIHVGGVVSMSPTLPPAASTPMTQNILLAGNLSFPFLSFTFLRVLSIHKNTFSKIAELVLLNLTPQTFMVLFILTQKEWLKIFWWYYPFFLLSNFLFNLTKTFLLFLIIPSSLQNYSNLLQLRVRMPLSDDLNPRNFITKISKYERVLFYFFFVICDLFVFNIQKILLSNLFALFFLLMMIIIIIQVVNIPNSMTILHDLLPLSIKMSLKKLTGVYNFTNPGVVSHNQILDLYKKYIDPSFTYSNFTEEEQSKSKNLFSFMKVSFFTDSFLFIKKTSNSPESWSFQ